MSHIQSIKDIAKFLEQTRSSNLTEATKFLDKTDEELKAMLYEARARQHSLVLGSVAEIENTKNIELATTVLESRDELNELKKTTLYSYSSKAALDLNKTAMAHGSQMYKDATTTNTAEEMDKAREARKPLNTKSINRVVGIQRAARRMIKPNYDAKVNEGVSFNDDDYYEYHPEKKTIARRYGSSDGWARAHMGSSQDAKPTKNGYMLQKGMRLKHTDIGKQLVQESEDLGEGTVTKLTPKDPQRFKPGDSVHVHYHDSEGAASHGRGKVERSTDAYAWVKHKNPFSGREESIQYLQKDGREPGRSAKGHFGISKAVSESVELNEMQPGAFHKWLNKSPDAPITNMDIIKGLASPDEHVRKMAQFAKNMRK